RLTQHLVEEVPRQPLHELHDLRLCQEGGLDVELRELGLPVGAQVLIPETAHDLVVPVEARHLQQLLEDLRRLRQGEELARVRAARHEIVACPLWGRLRQHRRLEIDEAVPIEKATNRACEPVPQPQTLIHHVATKVEVTVLETDLLTHLLIELEGQRLRAVEQLQLTGQQLHAAGSEVGVHSPDGTLTDPSLDADDELIAQPLRLAEDLGGIRVENHLQQTFAIAQIHENDPAVVPAPVHPARDLDRLADQLLVDLSAVMCTHRAGDVTEHPGGPQPEPRRPAARLFAAARGPHWPRSAGRARWSA